MKRISLITAIFFFGSLTLSAQKVKVLTGDLDILKGQDKVNTEYVYDNLMVGKLTEDEYLDKKKRDYNEKEPGRGEKFIESWNNDRPTRYHPKFEELINKYAPMAIGSYPDAEYTMKIHVRNIEPGFNVGVMRQSAYIDCDISIMDKDGNEKVLISVLKAPGGSVGGYDFEVGQRIQESYAISGKRVGALIKKACK